MSQPQQKVTYKTEKRIKVVPLMKLDFSLLDREYDNKPDRMIEAIKAADDEMQRMRSDFMGDSSKITQSRTTTSIRSTTSQVASTDFDRGSAFESLAPSAAVDSGDWFQQHPTSPLIDHSPTGDKQLKLRFDVHDYLPEEMEVKTVDNKLLVQAKHEEKSANKQVYREFKREFVLPKGVDPESVSSALSTDGILTVQAPLALPAPKEHRIPIEQGK